MGNLCEEMMAKLSPDETAYKCTCGDCALLVGWQANTDPNDERVISIQAMNSFSDSAPVIFMEAVEFERMIEEYQKRKQAGVE